MLLGILKDHDNHDAFPQQVLPVCAWEGTPSQAEKAADVWGARFGEDHADLHPERYASTTFTLKRMRWSICTGWHEGGTHNRLSSLEATRVTRRGRLKSMRQAPVSLGIPRVAYEVE